MQKIQFSKMHGAGNDFIILTEKEFSTVQSIEQVQFLCHRRLGVGSDGIIIIGPHDVFDFKMRFINPDGSEGMFCGNGSRCAVAKAYELGWMGKTGEFEAVDGPHKAIYHGPEDIEVQMIDIQEIQSRLRGYFVQTGAPHYVEVVQDLAAVDVEQVGRAVRYDLRFAPEGTNANFIEFHQGSLRIRTYERGVEKETLACGTGITAAAISYHHQLMSEDVVLDYLVIARGGKVRITARLDEEGIYRNVKMRGPVKEVFQATIDIPEKPFDILSEIPKIQD